MNLSTTLKKRLILIYNEGIEGTKSYLKGVLEDMTNYQAFFKSIEGGAWLPTEKKVFHKPTVNQVEDYIKANADSDYFLIVFCGHGGSLNQETILELDKGEDLPLNTLYSWVRHTRNLIILDCCRVAPDMEPIMESLNTRIRMFSEGGSLADHARARNEYNKAIKATNSRMSTIGYAASLDEEAGETSKGGFYSHSLLRAAAIVANETSTSETTATFLECHNIAEPAVIQLSKDEQHPDYFTKRLPNQLPFVVRV